MDIHFLGTRPGGSSGAGRPATSAYALHNERQGPDLGEPGKFGAVAPGVFLSFAHCPGVQMVRSLETFSGWQLALYPTAFEAGGSFVSRGKPSPHGYGVRGAAADPVRSRAEAARRARGKVRRYCAANRLNRLGTLTYRGEGCHDSHRVRADLGVFFRDLRVARQCHGATWA